MKIYWAGMEEKEGEDFEILSTLGESAVGPLYDELVASRKWYEDLWTIKKSVPVHFVQGIGSCYDLDLRCVYINIEIDKLDRSAITVSKYCLWHELTHAVQHKRRRIKRDRTSLLRCELHADIVAGYCLTHEIGSSAIQDVMDHAFEFPASGVHPPGCERQHILKSGLSVGAAVMSIDQDLFREISTRDEFFHDSWQHAIGKEYRPRICDLHDQSLELCAGCPNLLGVANNVSMVVGEILTSDSQLNSAASAGVAPNNVIPLSAGINSTKFKFYFWPNEDNHLGKAHVHVEVIGKRHNGSFDVVTGSMLVGDVSQRDRRDIEALIMQNSADLVDRYNAIRRSQLGDATAFNRYYPPKN